MSGNLMGSLRSRNISQIICERIAEGILSGDLTPGQRLPTEDEFAQRIGAGKSSVREAIKILEALGVVEIRRGDGTYVVNEFKGSMLDPVVYGILLSPYEKTDLVNFKIGVQHMVADDILAHDERDLLAQVHERLTPCACDAAQTQDSLAALLDAEELLAKAVTNPLVGELYRQTIRMCAPLLKSQASQLVPWMRSFVEALEVGETARVTALLDQARTILSV